MGETDKDFTFNLMLSKDGKNYTQNLTAVKAGAGITDSQSETLTCTSETSTYTFTLKHDQKIDIEVPYGYTATVTETEVGGYTTTAKKDGSGVTFPEDGGYTVTTEMDADHTVDYLNKYDMQVPTGVDTKNPGSSVMLGVAAASAVLIFGCSFLVWRRRRRDWM